MDAIISVPAIEFNEELFRKIEAIISGQDAEVVITVKQLTNKPNNDEEELAYWQKIDESINDLKTGNGSLFTMKEFETFIHEDSNT